MDRTLLEGNADRNLEFYKYVRKECFEILNVPNFSVSETLVVPSSDTAKVHTL